MITNATLNSIRSIESNNTTVYLYGSYITNKRDSRDIDILITGNSIKKTKLLELPSPVLNKTVNAYLVSDDDMMNDIFNLSAGGYYADKFVNGFRLIQKDAGNTNWAKIYWQEKWHNYKNKQSSDINLFVRQTREVISRYNPLFTRFINAGCDRSLIGYILDHVIPDYDSSDSSFTIHSEEMLEKSMYKFLKTYNWHKENKVDEWGRSVFKKISYISKVILKNNFNESASIDLPHHLQMDAPGRGSRMRGGRDSSLPGRSGWWSPGRNASRRTSRSARRPRLSGIG